MDNPDPRLTTERPSDVTLPGRMADIAESLRGSEAWLQSVLDNSPAVIYIKEPSGRYITINRRYEMLFHISREQITGKTDYDIFPREMADVFRANDLEVLQGGEPIEREEVAPQDDGLHTYLSVKFPLRDADGKVYAVCGISTDITSRKRVDEELRRLNESLELRVQQRTIQLKEAIESLRISEARYRAILESALDCVIAIDHSGAILDFNAAAERTFGVTRSQVFGKSLAEVIIPPPYRAAHYAGMKRYLETEVSHILGKRLDLEALRADGSLFPVELTVVRLPDSDPPVFTGILRDITDRKRAEEEIRALNSDLERRVESRTTELHRANRQLRDEIAERTRIEQELRRTQEEAHAAREVAEAANRAKSAFLATMSHEIRTPMNAIIGMSELALDTDLTREQREYVELVKKSADNLLILINEILDFSKIEAGGLELETVDFNVRQMVDDVLQPIALRAVYKGIELTCWIAPDVPEFLSGDPLRLRQVLLNLVGNAIKFTETGEVCLEMGLGAAACEGVVRLHVRVRDTGIGIPKDKIQLIFAPFTQADSSTTRKYGGTGLGLTISMRLVELMGGRIWVDSEPGQGSTFHFTAELAPCRVVPPNGERTRLTELRGLPVLVVDDNATNRRILEETLRAWHMRPTTAENAAAALRALEKARDHGEPFALVLLDGHMPGTDGFELAETMRRRPGLAAATVMMLTSASRAGDAKRCKELGIAAYLTKPVSQRELREAILTALGKTMDVTASRGAATPEPKAARPLHVLLAEDNPVNQQLAVRLLEKQGHDVVVVSSGRAAVERSSQEAFDLILMDVQMPEMDGLEATAAIRRREQAQGGHVPIIAMTAYAMKSDRDRCFAAGMDGYLSKPIRSDELLATIRAVAGAVASSARPPVLSELVDWRQVLEYVGGDEILLRDLTRTFLRQCSIWIDGIDRGLKDSDCEMVHANAHPLKNSMNMYCAAAAAKWATELEVMARRGTLAGGEEVFQSLRYELDRLLPAMHHFANMGGNRSEGAP